MKRPNIIFYFSDQQRADTLGCYGQKFDISPNADLLAAEGVKFEYAFTAQPVCGPARAIFQTGLYPTSINCYRNNKILPPDCNTIAKEMEKAGYDNAYVGKWHLASDGEIDGESYIDNKTKPVPIEYRGGYSGFWRASDVLEFTSDSYHGYIYDENNNRITFNGQYRTDFITDQALEFIDKHDLSKPFFLTVSHIEPHHQNNANHYQGPIGSKDRYKDFDPPLDLKLAGTGDWKEEYPDYLGGCSAIDRNLGRIITLLKKKKIYDDTIIIFTSDHGSHFRTRNNDKNKNGYDDYKRTCHDAALRVPLIIKGGVFKGGLVINDLVSTASIPKTIMSLAGISDTSCFIGENLADIVSCPDPDRDNAIFAQISESRVGRVIRTNDYKYAVVAPGLNGNTNMNSHTYIDDFLYNLNNDPYEQNNLINDPGYETVKEKLRKRLSKMIKEYEHMDVSISDGPIKE